MEGFASGAAALGETTVKLATAGRICVITDRAYPDKNLVNYSLIVDGLWYPGTATNPVPHHTDGTEIPSEMTIRLSTTVHSRFLPAVTVCFSSLLKRRLTPYADPLLRGSFTGIRAGHDKRHFSRAVFGRCCILAFRKQKCRENLGISTTTMRQ